mgnify:CR=1 FL=1
MRPPSIHIEGCTSCAKYVPARCLPSMFGRLDFAYVDRFDGENLLRDFDAAPHVYVANYQKLG